MPLLTWEDAYNVGVEEFDTQHKKMFGLINRLHESMKDELGQEQNRALLKELSDYGDFHLESEEKYMKKYKYPDYESHKLAHDSYRIRIQDFIARQKDMMLSFEIIDFLEDWWLGHITGVDKKYQVFFAGKINI